MAAVRDADPVMTVTSLAPATGGLRLEVLSNLFLAVEGAFVGTLFVAFGTEHRFPALGSVGQFAFYAGPGIAAAILFTCAAAARGFHSRSRWLQLGPAIKEGALTWLIIAISLSLVIAPAGVADALWWPSALSFVFAGLVGLTLLRWGEQRAVRHLAKAGSLAGTEVVLVRQQGYPFSTEAAGMMAAAGRTVAKTIVLPRSVDDPEFCDRMDELTLHVRANSVNELVIAASWNDAHFIEGLVEQLSAIPICVTLISDQGTSPLLRRPLVEFGPGNAIALQRPPLNTTQLILKRLFDTALAGLALTLLLPVLSLIAVAIVIDSPGPILFRQRRTGFNSRVFWIYKFRTMKVLDDGAVIRQAQRDDARVTRVGRVLRRLSLDELPQLFNILKGEMSLVGPRPHALAHDLKYGRLISTYAARQRVKPGITGWAQVNGWRGETPELYMMRKRIEHDLWYIGHWSLWLDVKIVVRTAIHICSSENAY